MHICYILQIKRYFADVLQSGEFRGKVIIFLDGLDQLTAEDSAHNLDWLPAKISSNVKIIVSSLPNHHRILERLHSKITQDDHYCEV